MVDNAFKSYRGYSILIFGEQNIKKAGDSYVIKGLWSIKRQGFRGDGR